MAVCLKSSAGTLTLSGANTYTGGTTLNNGTLAAGNNAAFGPGPLTINGGTLPASGGAVTLANKVTLGSNFTLGGANPLTLSGTVDLGAATRTLTVTNTANTTLSGVISGAAGAALQVNNTGGGTLTLSGANTYSGGTVLYASSNAVAAGSSSVLKPDGTMASGPFGTGTLTLDGGTLAASGSRTVSNAVTVTYHSRLGGGATDNLTLTGTINLGADSLHNNGDGTNTLSGVISGTGNIDQTSAGTLVLSGANTYTGGTYLFSGTLVAGSNQAFGTGSLSIQGGTLAASGAARTLDNATVNVDSNFTLGTGVAATNQNLTLSGAVTLYRSTPRPRQTIRPSR